MSAKWRHEARFATGPCTSGVISVRADTGLDGVGVSVSKSDSFTHVRVTLAELAAITDAFNKALASAEADAAEAELAKGAGDA